MDSRQVEENANNALGALLRAMMFRCSVRVENTRVVVGQAGLKPDILITAPDRAPVVVEAEFMPAAAAEQEAKDRLGLLIEDGRKPVEAAIALRYPAGLEFSQSVRDAMADARLEYAVLYKDGTRFPESGWLSGSAEDLAELARLASVPQEAVNAAANALEAGIESAVGALDDMAKLRPGITLAIAERLGMADVPQTRRMACAIIANALVFHERIAGMQPEVNPLRLVCGDEVADPQGATLAAWGVILKINYYSIFAIAKDLLGQLPPGDAARMLRTLRRTAQEVNATGVDNAHDLTGRIFQQLIADRKYLATFYTLPASAALLAQLAVAKMDGVDWSDAGAIGKLRVGDFACGTGALLSAVYDQMAARHERAGGDAAALHKAMMEEVLYGCDVMPSAIHITGSTLSGMQPNLGFEKSRLYTMPYGRQEDGSASIGSLELLQSSSLMTLFNMSDPVLRTGSAGEETAEQVLVEAPDEGFDLVIMNPPFTSNTSKEASHIGTFAPAFAAFNSGDEDQRDMAKRMRDLRKGTCYHGHAGMASAFAALGHRKLKPGGVLALVLPLTAASASSWQAFRELITSQYIDLTVMSIAASGMEMSFSSDTGMAECLVIARKDTAASSDNARPQARLTSLVERPKSFVHASMIANELVNADYIRGIEDGPFGGTRLNIGDYLSGESISTPVPSHGAPWGGLRTRDFSIAQTAYALTQSKLWLPNQSHAVDVKMTTLGEIGSLGRYDLDITGRPPQGPFDRTQPSPTATYPSLWNHNAKNETRFICEPDSQLIVRPGLEEKAATIWQTASRAHINRDFTFGSQALAVAFTEQDSIGGRVWPNVIFDDKRFDYAFAVWGNSTLGLLCYWWHSSRQQSSKASISIRSAESLPILDLRALSDDQLATSEAIFEEFRDKELKPAYIADADPNRALLDRRVIRDLLGFDEDTYEAVRRLSAKWCAEPSVHGGKRRPRGAALVV